MNREKIIKIAMVVCVTVLLCAVIITSTGMFESFGGGYADAELYTSGDAEITGEIRNLDISWTAGKVTVVYGQSGKASVAEEAPEKELTVTLPRGAALEQAEIHTTSGEIEIPEMAADVLILDSTSGDIRAAAEVKNAEINATSGDQEIRLAGEAEIVRLNSTSGNIAAAVEKALVFEAASTSGGIRMEAAECREAKANSTSGDISVSLGKLEKLRIDATSGSVTAALPEAPGFTAEVHTTSGDFSSGIALARDGDRYTCGDGSAGVAIGTTSGNVRLEKAEK